MTKNTKASILAPQRAELEQQFQAALSAKDTVKANQLLDQISKIDLENRVADVIIGVMSGQTSPALTKGVISEAADLMTQASWRNSMLFPGIVDKDGKVLSNISAGRLGGTRIDLDKICGAGYANCATVKDSEGNPLKNPDGTYVLQTNDKGQYIFKGDDKGNDTWGKFLATEAGQSMFGKTGGLQGWLPGTMFTKSYQPGDLIDTIVEAFAGIHDFLGGQITGLYDAQGSIKRGMSESERSIYDNLVTTTAIPVAAPFAASSALPPGTWNAISALVK